MPMQRELLKILADGRTHSGTEIGQRIGVSRTAVWKSMQTLQRTLDIEIYAVRGRGYRLGGVVELLDAAAIRAAMTPAASKALTRLELLLCIDSTNRYLMEHLDTQDGFAVLAERQTAGRGRRGRVWVSPFGGNIYLSLLWRFQSGPSDLAGLGLAVAVAIARCLQQNGVTDIGLKWPNDILWQGKKLCGVLLELRGESAGPCKVVVGLGMNVRMAQTVGEGIDQPWVDLETILGCPVSRNTLVGQLLSELIETMKVFQAQGLSPFLDAWRELDRYHHQAVELHLPDRTIRGIACGVDKHGALIVEHEGVRKSYFAGEISLKPDKSQTKSAAKDMWQ